MFEAIVADEVLALGSFACAGAAEDEDDQRLAFTCAWGEERLAPFRRLKRWVVFYRGHGGRCAPSSSSTALFPAYSLPPTASRVQSSPAARSGSVLILLESLLANRRINYQDKRWRRWERQEVASSCLKISELAELCSCW